MGLIKTAMMMGGGLYAVDKLAKASDKRRTSPNPQNRNQQDNYQYQDQPQRGYNPNQPQIRYNEQGEEQHWYPAPSYSGAAASRAYGDDKANARTAPQQSGHPALRERQLMDSEPPLYEPRPSQAHGFVMPEGEGVGSSSGTGYGRGTTNPVETKEMFGKERTV
jgi:hypothetical protein